LLAFTVTLNDLTTAQSMTSFECLKKKIIYLE
jgi:hypothetical protein